MLSTDHGDPENYVLINETVEVLVEEEEAGAYKGCVWEVQLTLRHVCDLQEIHVTKEMDLSQIKAKETRGDMFI